MSNVVGLLNQLLRSTLSARVVEATDPFQLTDVRLTTEGAHIDGRLEHPQARGDIALDLTVTSPGEGRYVLSLTVRDAPVELDARLEPFRGVLENLSADLKLEFGEPPARGE